MSGKAKGIRRNYRLQPETLDRLSKLSDHMFVPMTAVIETAVKRLYRAELGEYVEGSQTPADNPKSVQD